MRLTRRISSAFKDIEGGQLLGASNDYEIKLIDLDTAKLKKDIEKTETELKRVLGKLSNEKFLSKAPQDVVDKENGIKEELENKLAKLRENLELYKD